MLKDNLSRLGFSPSEIRIYLHLLKNGISYANKLSSETGINRTNVYEAIDRLISKGVVSFITRNKVKWSEARSPDSILSLIKEKEEEIKETKDDVLRDLNNLKTDPGKRSLEANVFVGKKGLRMIFEEMLEVKKPVCLIAAELQFKELFRPYFELWHKKRIEKGIRQRSIFPKRFKPRLKNRPLLAYKFVDDRFTNPTTTVIYGENCVFIQWSEEPVAVRIQNKEITRSHLNYFNMLWNS